MNAATIRNLIVGGVALAASACAEQGLAPSQQNALIGAGVGALAGAAIADDDATGALIGAAAGGAIGYYTGCRQQGGCYVGGRQVANDRIYDQRAGRYYYVDPQTGRTYWENGEYRG